MYGCVRSRTHISVCIVYSVYVICRVGKNSDAFTLYCVYTLGPHLDLPPPHSPTCTYRNIRRTLRSALPLPPLSDTLYGAGRTNPRKRILGNESKRFKILVVVPVVPTLYFARTSVRSTHMLDQHFRALASVRQMPRYCMLVVVLVCCTLPVFPFFARSRTFSRWCRCGPHAHKLRAMMREQPP